MKYNKVPKSVLSQLDLPVLLAPYLQQLQEIAQGTGVPRNYQPLFEAGLVDRDAKLTEWGAEVYHELKSSGYYDPQVPNELIKAAQEGVSAPTFIENNGWRKPGK